MVEHNIQFPLTSDEIEKYQHLLQHLKRGGDQHLWHILCPVHGEKHASATAIWGEDDSWWNCQACERIDPATGKKVGSSIKSLIRWMKNNKKFDNNVTNIGSAKQPAAREKNRAPASESEIDAWAEILEEYLDGEDDHFLIRDRGLTLDTIKEWKLGLRSNRITIPVYDPTDGSFCGARVYNHKPESEKDPKIYWHGSGDVGLFGRIDEESHSIVFVEGEFDAILAWQLGFSAITVTGGVRSFPKLYRTLAKIIPNLDVYIFLDNDEPGHKIADRLEEWMRNLLPEQSPARVFRVRHEYDKDLTDIVVKHGLSEEDVRRLVFSAECVWTKGSTSDEVPDADAPLLTLSEAMGRKYQGQVVRVRGRVTTVPIGESFKTPFKFEISCAMNKGKRCDSCPMFSSGGKASTKIRAGDREQLAFIGADDEKINKIIARKLHLSCTDIYIERLKDINVRKITIQNDGTPIMSPKGKGLADGERVIVLSGIPESVRVDNKIIEIVGKPVSDPNNQKGGILAWGVDVLASNHEQFKFDSAWHKRMQQFQAVEGQSPLEKVQEIAHDLSMVTGIVRQDLMHQVMLLTWTSALEFEFDKALIIGALDVMIVGDTGTGKSQAIKSIINHFGCGEMITAENASLPGLTIGMTPIEGAGWNVRPGAFPRNHRMLVAVDEVSGLIDKNIFENMSSIRTDGVAMTTKIESASLPAKLRRIWMGNPPKNTPAISDMSETGITALKMIFKAREDIRRFDVAVGVLKVPTSVSGRLHRTGKTKYDSSLHSRHKEWVWSRTADNITWDEGTQQYLAEQSIKEAKKYRDDIIPLITGAEFRINVARVAVAIALATYATEDGENVIIDNEHVDSALEFYDTAYRSPGMPYIEHSAAQKVYVPSESKVKERAIYTKEELDFLKWCHAANTFVPDRFWGEKMIAKEMLGRLLSIQAVTTNDGYTYTINQNFKTYLKEVTDAIKER